MQEINVHSKMVGLTYKIDMKHTHEKKINDS